MAGAVDVSELVRWERALRTAGRRAGPAAKAVVSKGALNIKIDARRLAPGTGHARLYPGSITYELAQDGPAHEAVIGPEPGKPQWGLGNLLEFGSVHNEPHPHLGPALDAEEPRFVNAAADLGVKLIITAWEV